MQGELQGRWELWGGKLLPMTQVGLLEPLPSLTSPKTYQAYGRRGSEAPAEASILLLQALGVDAEEVPHGTHVALLGGLKDVLASGMTRAQPLGSCWKVARLVNRDTQIAIPSRTGKPEIKKPSWNLQHCMDFVLFPAWGWGWQSRSRGARFPTHRTLDRKMLWKINLTITLQI